MVDKNKIFSLLLSDTYTRSMSITNNALLMLLE